MYSFAVRNMRYAVGLDADGDGWPEGSGNVERAGMGQEKLDVAVYTIRGLLDLADMAYAKGDKATAAWANAQAIKREQKFEETWWYGGDAKSYADSLSDPGNVKLYQRYWIGVTPMEAELDVRGGSNGPLASIEHGNVGLTQRERDCFTGDFGFFHTGTGPTSDPGGNKGPSCDSVALGLGSERDIFSLGNSIMAVGEGNYGRLTQQQRYTTANARSQLEPSVWEMPGAMPEIVPSPDFGTNIEQGLPQPLQRYAVVGRLRDPLAGSSPATRSQPGPGQRQAIGGTAGPGWPDHREGYRHPGSARAMWTSRPATPARS